MIRSWEKIYASELTPQGGPNPPERIELNLGSNARNLRGIAQKVFSRWAALL
jgi:hypothetical protein